LILSAIHRKKIVLIEVPSWRYFGIFREAWEVRKISLAESMRITPECSPFSASKNESWFLIPIGMRRHLTSSRAFSLDSVLIAMDGVLLSPLRQHAFQIGEAPSPEW
jgi:hypothetical protein